MQSEHTEKVWVKRARGTMPEGTVLRQVGGGLYGVLVSGHGPQRVFEEELVFRHEDEGAGEEQLTMP